MASVDDDLSEGRISFASRDVSFRAVRNIPVRVGSLSNFACIEKDDDDSEQEADVAGDAPSQQVLAGAERRVKQRSYNLDWMRVISIYLVVLFHCFQALDLVQVWVKPNNLIPHSYMATGYQVGMQLFFHLSGRAQAFSPPVKVCSTIQKRVVRLLLPFGVAYMVLIPPWICIADCKGQGNIFSFYIWYFLQGNFYLEMAWLWFLPALFLITLVCLPVMNYMEVKREPSGYISICGAVIIVVVFRLMGYSWVFSIVSQVALAAGVALNAYIPFPAAGESEPSSDTIIWRWRAIRINTFVFILTSLILCGSFSYEGDHVPAIPDVIPGFMIFLYMYMQGYMTQRWRSGCAAFIETDTCGPLDLERMKKSISIWELFSGFGTLAILFSCNPVNTSAPPFWERQTVPIYSASFLDDPTFAVASMLGTWAWVGVAMSMCQAYANKEVDKALYKHAAASTTIVYIFHWIFIRMFVWWIVETMSLKCGVWRILNVPLTFGVAVGGSLGVYWISSRVPWLGLVFGIEASRS